MTSRNLFFKLIREDLKRRVWAVCLAFLSFFFMMPVAAAMGISSLNRRVERWIIDNTVFPGITMEQEKYTRLLRMAEEVLGMQNIAIALIVGMAAIILGLTGFSWLHSKKKVDFYHSIPVRRELLFAVKYLDGILIVFSMYLLNLILVCGVFAVNGLGIGETFLPGIITMLVHLVNYVLMYTVVLTAVVMTGNFFISILGTIVFYSYVPLFTNLLMALSYMFFETASYSDSYWNNIIIHGSPVSYYAKLLSVGNDLAMNQYYQMLPKLVFPVFVALCLLLFCLLLYRWRPSEAAGKAMAFKHTKAPIKILLVVPFTIIMGLFFWNVYYSLGWAAFGFLFGLVITHCIIEIIYHFDFRKLFSHLPHMAVCGILALAVIGIYRFDLAGYDRYLPSEKQFAAVSMKCESLKDWLDYGIPVKDEENMRWTYMSQENYVKNNMNLADYDTVRAIAEAGIVNAKDSKEQKFKNKYSYYYGADSKDGYWTDVELTYHLKSGRRVSRRYMVDVNNLREDFDRIYTTEEYKKGNYPVLSYHNDNLSGIYSLRNYRIQEVRADENLRGEILAAYQEELTALSLDARSKETPIAALRFLTIAEREYISQISRQRNPEFTGEFRLSDMRNVNFFPVYPSFTKTIALLKEAGFDVAEKADVADVEKVEIYSRHKVTRAAEKIDSTVHAETVEEVYYESVNDDLIVFKNDTAEHGTQIGQILDSIIPQDMAEMNGLQQYEFGVQVRVYLNSVNSGFDSDTKEFDGYYFAWNEMPEFIKELIQYDDLVYKNINYGLNEEED